MRAKRCICGEGLLSDCLMHGDDSDWRRALIESAKMFGKTGEPEMSEWNRLWDQFRTDTKVVREQGDLRMEAVA